MELNVPPPVPATPSRGWWSRNWKWSVPVGCLGAVGLFVCLALAILSFVFGVLKSSVVYTEALGRAQAHEQVGQILGTPLQEGRFLSGNISVNGASGEADLAIPVSGPKGKGTLYVVATKSAGQWSYSVMTLEVAANGERINLLE